MDRLVQAVVQDVPEAPLMTVRDMLAWAEVRLCDQGNAWIVDDAEVTDAGTIAVPAGEPIRVLEVLRNGRVMTSGIDYEQTTPLSVEVFSASNADTVTARVAVKPTDTDPFPDALKEQHFEALRHGAVFRLLMLPQPWRNVDQAMYHEKHFMAGVSDAYRFSIYGQHRNARVKKRRFV